MYGYVCLRWSHQRAKGSQSGRKKMTSNVDLMKNKLTLKLHSQELLLKAALGLPVSHIIYKIPHCCYWPRLSVCSQVSEPRAGCHASGHSWRIHLSFGMSSSYSGCSQWAVPSERLNTSEQPLVRNVTERTFRTALLQPLRRQKLLWWVVLDQGVYVFLYFVLILYLNKPQRTLRICPFFV